MMAPWISSMIVVDKFFNLRRSGRKDGFDGICLLHLVHWLGWIAVPMYCVLQCTLTISQDIQDIVSFLDIGVSLRFVRLHIRTLLQSQWVVVWVLSGVGFVVCDRGGYGIHWQRDGFSSSMVIWVVQHSRIWCRQSETVQRVFQLASLTALWA